MSNNPFQKRTPLLVNKTIEGVVHPYFHPVPNEWFYPNNYADYHTFEFSLYSRCHLPWQDWL